MTNERKDYTIPNGLGIRFDGDGKCQVIRRQRGMWKEIGRKYHLPLSEEDLSISAKDIPASVIAVALRAYEMSNPGSSLRRELTTARVLCASY